MRIDDLSCRQVNSAIPGDRTIGEIPVIELVNDAPSSSLQGFLYIRFFDNPEVHKHSIAHESMK